MLTAGKSVGQFSLYYWLHDVKVGPLPSSFTGEKSLTLVPSLEENSLTLIPSPGEREDLKIEAEEASPSVPLQRKGRT